MAEVLHLNLVPRKNQCNGIIVIKFGTFSIPITVVQKKVKLHEETQIPRYSMTLGEHVCVS